MKLLTNFDVNLTSFLEVKNKEWNAEFVRLPGDEARLTSEFVMNFSF